MFVPDYDVSLSGHNIIIELILYLYVVLGYGGSLGGRNIIVDEWQINDNLGDCNDILYMLLTN